jgi:hypothetical protein
MFPVRSGILSLLIIVGHDSHAVYSTPYIGEKKTEILEGIGHICSGIGDLAGPPSEQCGAMYLSTKVGNQGA